MLRRGKFFILSIILLSHFVIGGEVFAADPACKIDNVCYGLGDVDPTGQSGDPIDQEWLNNFCKGTNQLFESEEMCGLAERDGACKCGNRCLHYGETVDEFDGGQVMPGQCGNCTEFPTSYQSCVNSLAPQGGGTSPAVQKLSQYANELNKLQADSLPELVGTIIKGVMGVIGTIALIMIIYGGILWMTARGNAETTAKAQDTVVWAALGIVLIFASYALVDFVFEIFR